MRIIHRGVLLLAAILSFACLTAPAQEYRILHHFAGGAADAAKPFGSLIQSGSTFYGMTQRGGSNNVGTIFRINTDGTGFQLMHSFNSPGADGSRPYGALLQSGSILYALITSEEVGYWGKLARINTDGTGYQVLRTFSGNEGKWPYGSPIQSGSVLYGMNTFGGNNTGSGWVGNGTIFRVNADGTGFRVLHTFVGGTGDGSWPHGTLTQSGSTLFGTTLRGGSAGCGTIFKINTDGTNYQLLHTFVGGASNGASPYFNRLLQSGSTLYGMTSAGGSSNLGTLYKLNTNGTGFQLLHSFTGGDGSDPGGALVLSGSTLYGTACDGPGGTGSSIFQIDTNGTGFQSLHQFTGGDGKRPHGSVILSGATFYGMTFEGGSNNLGVIFALDLLPRLSIGLSETNINLSWRTNFPGFVLEGVTQLNSTWTTVPGVTGCSATLPVNAESQFFRLKK